MSGRWSFWWVLCFFPFCFFWGGGKKVFRVLGFRVWGVGVFCSGGGGVGF